MPQAACGRLRRRQDGACGPASAQSILSRSSGVRPGRSKGKRWHRVLPWNRRPQSSRSPASQAARALPPRGPDGRPEPASGLLGQRVGRVGRLRALALWPYRAVRPTTPRDRCSRAPPHTQPCNPTHPACNPTHPACTRMHPAGTPTHPAGTPTHPACTPTHPACTSTHPACGSRVFRRSWQADDAVGSLQELLHRAGVPGARCTRL